MVKMNSYAEVVRNPAALPSILRFCVPIRCVTLNKAWSAKGINTEMPLTSAAGLLVLCLSEPVAGTLRLL